MNAGTLKHRLTILIPYQLYNWGGGGTISWITYATVWGEIIPLRGKERFDDDKIKADISHVIKIRYKKGITPSMRITFNDRIFDIKNILNKKEEDRELQIECLEVLSGRES